MDQQPNIQDRLEGRVLLQMKRKNRKVEDNLGKSIFSDNFMDDFVCAWGSCTKVPF